MINPLKLSLPVLLFSASLAHAAPQGIWGGSNSLTQGMSKRDALAFTSRLSALIEHTNRKGPYTFGASSIGPIMGAEINSVSSEVTLKAQRWATTMPVEKRLKKTPPTVKASLSVAATYGDDVLTAVVEPVYKGRKMVGAMVVNAAPNKSLREKMPTCVSSNSIFRGFIRKVILFAPRFYR